MADVSNIYLVLIPTRAAAGETVDIEVYVRNKMVVGVLVYVLVQGSYEPDTFIFNFLPDCMTPVGGLDPDCPPIYPGGSQRFDGSFVMPDHDVDVMIRSWYWHGYWDPEEELHYYVLLEVSPPPPAEFSSFQVAQYI